MDSVDWETRKVDGQSMIIPSGAQWADILGHPESYNEISFNGLRDLIKFFLDLVTRYPSTMTLGAFRPGKASKFIPIVLLDIAGRWMRVQLETVYCLKCDWRGVIANPTEPTLYFGAEDEFAVLAKAAEFASTHIAPCPACGTPLPRNAIWAAYSASSAEIVE